MLATQNIKWMVLISLSILMIRQAESSEIVGGGEGANSFHSTNGHASFAAMPDKDSESTVLDGREYKVETQKFLPDIKKLEEHVCSSVKSKNSVCSKWPEAEKSYIAAAKVLGVPAQVLMCLTRIESNMTAGAASGAGAKGLTQFMPKTAEDFQRKFNSTSDYKKAWANYKTLGGTTKSASAFNQSDINSSSLGNSDVQIFATALYFRDILNTTEKYWKNHVGEPPNVAASKLRKMYHYMMISYNAGPKKGEQFIVHGLNDYKFLPKETQGYVDNFDSCIDMGRFGKTKNTKAEGRRPND